MGGVTWAGAERLVRVLRRALLVLLGVQLVLAVGMSLVDSHRRRGKRPRPFPVTEPREVPIGEGSVRVYTYGRDLFDDMLEAIGRAEHRVLFETYIWKTDAMGQRFEEALADAARRGVEVHVVYDGFANLVSPRVHRYPAHMHVMRFPVWAAGWRVFDWTRYGRDHRKILVVDDTEAFVGGYNVGSAYETEWRDTHVRLTGAAVGDLQRAFADFWNLNRRRVFSPSHQPLLLGTGSAWEPRIRLQRNVPRLWMFPIRSMYLEAFTRASRNIWITQAYFIPDQDLVDALSDAARRGVDVRVLVPLKSNHIVADWLSRGFYSDLLAAGVRILRYQGMVHAKTCTVDGSWSTVGTANIDRLSLSGNYEINVEVIDPDLARVLEEVFLLDESHSLELGAAEWEARDLHRKFTELLLRPLRPLL